MSDDRERFIPDGISRKRGFELAAEMIERAAAEWRSGRGDRGCHDNAALVAAYERGMAEGRRRAADAIRAEADNASVIEGGPDLLRWAAEIAECPRCPLGICSAHRPAEPVEDSARRIQADVIRQAIAAIATLGPISGERWMAELERFAQIVEEGSDD